MRFILLSSSLAFFLFFTMFSQVLGCSYGGDETVRVGTRIGNCVCTEQGWVCKAT